MNQYPEQSYTIMRNSMVSKKTKSTVHVGTGNKETASLVMPNGDPWYLFFHPTCTFIIYEGCSKNLKFSHKSLSREIFERHISHHLKALSFAFNMMLIFFALFFRSIVT